MADIEIFIKEKLNPVYRLWYATWVLWWPAWRAFYSGPHIRRKWTEFDLVKEGQYFLDFGCGTGDFSLPAAKIVGARGRVYALDCNPRQLGIVEKRAKKAGFNNIETVLSEQKVNLPDESVDIVWMCDVLHEIRDKQNVIAEANRILKPGGLLVIYDGLKEKILNYSNGLFRLDKQDGKLFKMVK